MKPFLIETQEGNMVIRAKSREDAELIAFGRVLQIRKDRRKKELKMKTYEIDVRSIITLEGVRAENTTEAYKLVKKR